MLLIRGRILLTLFLLSIVYIVFYLFLGHPFNFIRSWIMYNRVQPLEDILPLNYPYALPSLPYEDSALEPHIDQITVQIHHQFHHNGYIKKLNDALKTFPELQKLSLVYLLTNLHKLPQPLQTAVRNNGGGHLAHTLYWYCMAPQKGEPKPSKTLVTAIEKNFGSLDSFKKQFSQAAISQFASGWTWLCICRDNKLVITSTSGHDTPLEQGLFPLLVADVWEHAYYLSYKNKRSDYVSSWWNLVNWTFTERLYLFYLGAFSQ